MSKKIEYEIKSLNHPLILTSSPSLSFVSNISYFSLFSRSTFLLVFLKLRILSIISRCSSSEKPKISWKIYQGENNLSMNVTHWTLVNPINQYFLRSVLVVVVVNLLFLSSVEILDEGIQNRQDFDTACQ